MKKSKAELPGELGRLLALDFLGHCECLHTLRFPEQRVRESVDVLEDLAKEQGAERFGLCDDDWSWDWGVRVSRGPDRLEARSFRSYATYLLPSTDSPKSERDLIFEGGYHHQLVDWNGERVLEMRLGLDSCERTRTLLYAVRQFKEGPWIDLVKAIVPVDPATYREAWFRDFKG